MSANLTYRITEGLPVNREQARSFPTIRFLGTVLPNGPDVYSWEIKKP